MTVRANFSRTRVAPLQEFMQGPSHKDCSTSAGLTAAFYLVLVVSLEWCVHFHILEDVVYDGTTCSEACKRPWLSYN